VIEYAASNDVRPTLGISMGDPLGIGPEVIVKALADRALRKRARFVIYGFSGALQTAADRAAIDPFWWRIRRGADVPASRPDVLLIDYEPDIESETPIGTVTAKPTRTGGVASFRFVEDAIADARAGTTDGIVTGPISKEAWALAGKGKYPGHTELLSTRFNAKRTRMMFVAPRLNVILATAHIPLMDIRNVLTIGCVHDTIDLGHQACEQLGIERPRIAVCGLNPHAGEAGILGDEEQRVIEPAIRLAREHDIRVEGPFPGDTIFRAAVRGQYDLVVAMYHDQGLIPVKLLAFDAAVNATVGLPSVRTSPDHGTAYDIAGRNVADPGSMRAAIELAIDLAVGRQTEAVSPRG
jgi:4-hydroxythreonine-4-phosphate dehydrogenase